MFAKIIFKPTRSLVVIATLCGSFSNAQTVTDGPTAYAKNMIAMAGSSNVEFHAVESLGHDEAFCINKTNNRLFVAHQTSAGALYGAQAIIQDDYTVEKIERPDFKVRGTTLCLMSGGNDYVSTLSDKQFPWFYDKAFMTRMLDVFAKARINTLFVWSGHLFPYIVEMPEYPEASADVSAGQVKANQEQFRWFTQECEKRNIKVLLHFYNIHVSPPFASKHGMRTNPTTPTPLLANYTYYALSRYFSEFPAVGLYACPGESIKSEKQLEWFRDVVFKAAIDSGKNPLVVIRDWTLNADFQSKLKHLYPNVYSELKHNDESVTTPYPDVRHTKWEGLANGHIINAAHGPAEDLQPMRWASPAFVQEMAQHWKAIGFATGVEFWGQSFWRWPYTLDSLTEKEPGSVLDKDGRNRLLYLDRDEAFYVLAGRAMWQTERDPGKDETFWENYYTKRFSSAAIGERMAKWYVVSGEISPGLQNLNATKVANFWATVLLMNQNIGQILDYNKDLAETPYTLNREAGRAEQRYYPRPFGNYIFQRYQNEYNEPKAGLPVTMYPEFEMYAKRMGIENLAQRHCMPVTQYAKLMVSGKTAPTMTPDKLVRLLNKMAHESLSLAKEMETLNTQPAHQGELHRFVTDSEMYVLATQAMIHKEDAAILKAQMLISGNRSQASAFVAELEASVKVYAKLAALTDATYLFANELRGYRWSQQGIAEFRADLEREKRWAEGASELKAK